MFSRPFETPKSGQIPWSEVIKYHKRVMDLNESLDGEERLSEEVTSKLVTRFMNVPSYISPTVKCTDYIYRKLIIPVSLITDRKVTL